MAWIGYKHITNSRATTTKVKKRSITCVKEGEKIELYKMLS